VSASPRLELRQSQSLVMTPQMQQALRMLQMSNQELAEHVETLVEANPLLRLKRPEGPPPEPRRTAGPQEPDGIDRATATISLTEHLRRQLGLRKAAPRILDAALAIVEEIEPDGYLRVPLAELAARHRLSPAEAEGGLALVQSCEPTGVGARSLAECLTLQCAERGLLDATMARLLAGLPLLASHGRAALAAHCGLDQRMIEPLLARLRRLDPRPGSAFGDATVAVAIPDILVRRAETGWAVEVNPDALPRVLVDNVYAARLAAHGGAVRRHVSEYRMQATWLVRSLEQRARTLLAVATSIVQHQEHFFTQGVSGLRPLSRRALAEKVGLHESTVSRVTADKYLACDMGLFAFCHFFSQAIPARDGEPVAAAVVRDRIRALIGAERPTRTLSDDRIVAILRSEGIDIARRTVAKYRDGLGIPSSVERRRLSAAGGP
jgi:RNA polymerase sigma-54 factor